MAANTMITHSKHASYTLYQSPRITVKDDMVILQIPNFRIFQEVHRQISIGFFSNYKSKVFTLSTGYTFRIIVYTCGLGTARENYLSVYVQLLPNYKNYTFSHSFRGVITFVVIDQSGKAEHHSKSIRTGFHKPLLSESLPYGIRELLPLEKLVPESAFIFGDQLILGVALRYNENVL